MSYSKWLRKIIYVIASEMKWSEAISKPLRSRSVPEGLMLHFAKSQGDRLRDTLYSQ